MKSSPVDARSPTFRAWLAVALALLAACDRCGAPGLHGTTAAVEVDREANLGRGWVGEPLTGSFAVRATGSGFVRVTRIAPADASIELSWDGAPGVLPVPPGNVREVAIRWHPSGPAVLDTTIEVETDVPDAAPATVRVRGEALPFPDCDDHNPCTDDAFDRERSACTHAVHERACDDGNACTVEDRCQGGVCLGRALSCDDGSACTSDFCDPVSGCVHPPDPTVCDDHDPCTADVCGASGCSHPPAEDGTSCGALSCAEAKVCIRGTCRSLDVRGSSDGFPCSDGDRCTEGDVCGNGVCLPGTPRADGPRVVAELETWGSREVATDGLRYLFADADAVRVGLVEQGALRIVAKLPFVATSPVNAGPGRFVVLRDAATIVMIDATDARHPVVSWEREARLDPGDFDHAIAVLDDGLAVSFQRSTGVGPPDFRLAFLPLGPGGVPAAPLREVLHPSFPGDRDAFGSALAIVEGRAAHYLAVVGDGLMVRNLSFGLGYDSAAPRVSVFGLRIAVLEGERVEVFDVSPTVSAPVVCHPGQEGCAYLGRGCDGSYLHPNAPVLLCPDGTGCGRGAKCVQVTANTCPNCPGQENWCGEPVKVCLTPEEDEVQLVADFPAPPRAVDVALDQDGFYFATETDIEFIPADVVHGANLRPRVVDPGAAERVVRAPGHLVTTGSLALPLRRISGDEGVTLQRVTGIGHGQVNTLTAAEGGRVLAGGPAAVAVVDPAGVFSAWQLTEAFAGPWRHRLFEGANGRVAMRDIARGSVSDRSECSGVDLDVVAADGTGRAFPVCGLGMTSIEVSNDELWASREADPFRVLRYPMGAAIGPLPASVRAPNGKKFLRASAARDRMLVVGEVRIGGAVQTQIEVYDTTGRSAAVPVLNLPGSIGFDIGLGSFLDVDGDMLLLAQGRTLAMFDTQALLPSQPIATMPLRRASGAPTRVEAMAGGRAWLTAGTAGGVELAEIDYDRSARALSDRGSVALPSVVTAVYDAGESVVVASPEAVRIVEPACR